MIRPLRRLFLRSNHSSLDDEEQFIISRESVRWLCLRSRVERKGMVSIEQGKFPEKRLSERNKEESFDRFSRGAKLPVSSLPERVKCHRRFRLIIEDGISPAKPKFERCKISKFVSLSNSGRNEKESK